ncbi:50S ribosomal protein L23 [Staphylococcus epidermidis 36-1]|nr:50S ribosomal protein L23 [Staphylococcus epidermidis 36-1]
MEARDVLKRPVITEKSSEAMAEDKYTFDVDTRANKTQVKIAVEEIFDVKVDSVNIINYKPKKKRMGRYQGIQTKEEKRLLN